MLSLTMLAIPDQSMNVSVCDSKVRTLWVGTGEALGVHPFRSSPPAFDFAPRAHRERRWFSNCRDGGREATGWTIVRGAWFEKTLDHGVYRLCSQVREVMMRPVKVPKPR